MPFYREISAVKSEIKPDLRFGRFSISISQFVHEHFGILSFSESLGNIGGNAARGAADLICQRILLILRKGSALIKNLHRQSVS